MHKNKKIVGIIQARTGSTRLPNKVLINIEGKSILEHVINRIKKVVNLDLIVVATTNLKEDDDIVKLANKLHVSCFRGSVNNVLDRFVKAAERYGADVIVRVCADNPLIDPKLTENLIERHIKSYSDYTSYRLGNLPTILTHLGVSPEVVSLKALKKSLKLVKKKEYKEHVTSFVYKKQDMFKLRYLELPSYLRRNDIRLTVDTGEDIDIIKSIYKKFYKTKKIFDLEKVITFIDKNPYIIDTMKRTMILEKKV